MGQTELLCAVHACSGKAMLDQAWELAAHTGGPGGCGSHAPEPPPVGCQGLHLQPGGSDPGGGMPGGCQHLCPVLGGQLPELGILLLVFQAHAPPMLL